jgi:hypothetical protein
VRIIEEAAGYTTHRLFDGKWLHDVSFGDYTGAVQVECFQCGFHRRYTRSQVPGWVEALLDKALAVQP